jgi:ORMDL family protein
MMESLSSIGAWMIHVVLIATGKVIIDVIPGVTQNISWTAVNLSYLAVRPVPCFPKTPHSSVTLSY